MQIQKSWAGILLAAGIGMALAAEAPAPDFKTTTLSGASIGLSTLEGQVVLLNFWGTWCRPCRSEIPELNALYAELQPRGLEILGIAVGDERDAVERFVTSLDIHYPIALDDRVADLYDVNVYPTNVVIDQAGRLHHVEEGYDPATAEVLRRIIEELLDAEPTPSKERSEP